MARDITTWRFLLTGDGLPGQVYETEIEAVAAAGARPSAQVVCVTRSGVYTTRQTVWPTVGQLYAGAG